MSLYSPNESTTDDCYDEQFNILYPQESDLFSDSTQYKDDLFCETIDNLADSSNKDYIPETFSIRSSTRISEQISREEILPSPSSATNKMKRNPLSQNAILAKANREKKKEFVSSLQERIAELEHNNSNLKNTNNRLRTTRRTLRNEVTYLKRVLRNDSSLSTILNQVQGVEQLSFSTRFSDERKQANNNSDHNYERTPFDNVDKVTGSGVCLHIDGAQASLEFCANCSRHASQPRIFDSTKDDLSSEDDYATSSNLVNRKRKYN